MKASKLRGSSDSWNYPLMAVIILGACGMHRSAREDRLGGLFTQAFLASDVKKKVREIIREMNIDGQTPFFRSRPHGLYTGTLEDLYEGVDLVIILARPPRDLPGVSVDAKNVTDYFSARGKPICDLSDVDDMVKMLQVLRSTLAETTHVLIYVAGHGTNEYTANQREPTGFDTSLSWGNEKISDDQLSLIMPKDGKQRQIVWFFDTCNAEGMVDDVFAQDRGGQKQSVSRSLPAASRPAGQQAQRLGGQLVPRLVGQQAQRAEGQLTQRPVAGQQAQRPVAGQRQQMPISLKIGTLPVYHGTIWSGPAVEADPIVQVDQIEDAPRQASWFLIKVRNGAETARARGKEYFDKPVKGSLIDMMCGVLTLHGVSILTLPILVWLFVCLVRSIKQHQHRGHNVVAFGAPLVAFFVGMWNTLPVSPEIKLLAGGLGAVFIPLMILNSIYNWFKCNGVVTEENVLRMGRTLKVSYNLNVILASLLFYHGGTDLFMSAAVTKRPHLYFFPFTYHSKLQRKVCVIHVEKQPLLAHIDHNFTLRGKNWIATCDHRVFVELFKDFVGHDMTRVESFQAGNITVDFKAIHDQADRILLPTTWNMQAPSEERVKALAAQLERNKLDDVIRPELYSKQPTFLWTSVVIVCKGVWALLRLLFGA